MAGYHETWEVAILDLGFQGQSHSSNLSNQKLEYTLAEDLETCPKIEPVGFEFRVSEVKVTVSAQYLESTLASLRSRFSKTQR